MKEIAVVRLAPGKVAYYDDYTKIHLTLSNPTATIYDNMNLKRIKNSVKFNVLQVVVGSLNTDVTEVPVEVEKPKIFTAPVIEKTIDETIHEDVKDDAPVTEITETPIEVESDKHEEVIAEEIVEESDPEPVETESKPKRGRKKNTEKEIAE